MIPPGPLPNTHWTILGAGPREAASPSHPEGYRTVECRCVCGTVRIIREARLTGSGGPTTRSCGCRRGEAVSRTAQEAFDGSWCPAEVPPNGFAVVLSGSVRGEKWAAGAPELPDPWYVGPRETELALRFRDRREAREWIGRRRVAVRSPGEYRVVPLAFAESAPRWLPVPLTVAIRHASAAGGVDSRE